MKYKSPGIDYYLRHGNGIADGVIASLVLPDLPTLNEADEISKALDEMAIEPPKGE